MKNAFLCSFASPSMRREWIEMMSCGLSNNLQDVSLHAEGVD